MSIFFVYFAVFVGVLIATDTLMRAMSDRIQRKRYLNHRLSLIEHDADRKVVYKQLLKERGLDASTQQTINTYLNKIYSQSGLRLNKHRLVIYLLATVVLCTLVNMFAGLSVFLGLCLAVGTTAVLAFMFLLRARTGRIKKFTGQLPDAIDIMVRSLSAGHPVPISISLVARETRDPIGTEFGILSDELTYGVDIDTGIRNMAARVGAEELSLLAISLSVQNGSGGNLSEILSNLADMIRKRVMMRSKIKAISAEGRMTSWFMLAFPFILYGIIRLMNADYFDPLWNSGYGNHFLAFSGGLLFVGMIVIRKIINFDY